MSARLRVRFLPSGSAVRVPPGTWLTSAAALAGAAIVHDCDGQGVCGTCRVRIASGASGFGPPGALERAQLGEDVEAGWRLCCLLVVRDDCEIHVPAGGFAYPPERQRGPLPR